MAGRKKRGRPQRKAKYEKQRVRTEANKKRRREKLEKEQSA